MATSYTAIRDSLSGVISTSTPEILPDCLWKPVNNRVLLEDLMKSPGPSSAILRAFQWRWQGVGDLPHLEPEIVQKSDSALLVVSYPLVSLAVYGIKDRSDLEKVIRSDCKQLREIITSPGNYEDDQYVSWVSVLKTQAVKGAWLQPLLVRWTYNEVR